MDLFLFKMDVEINNKYFLLSKHAEITHFFSFKKYAKCSTFIKSENKNLYHKTGG